MAYRPVVSTVSDVEVPVWRAMLAAAEAVSVQQLHAATSAHPNAIQTRLRRWEHAGLVLREGQRPIRYRLTDTARAANDDQQRPPQVTADGSLKPRVRTQRARLWSAIRVLKRFTLPELMIASGASRRSAEDIVNCLQRAGYVALKVRGNPMTGSCSVYLLARHAGPKAPVISWRDRPGGRVRILRDPNSGVEIDISPAAVSLRRRAAPAVIGGDINHDC